MKPSGVKMVFGGVSVTVLRKRFKAKVILFVIASVISLIGGMLIDNAKMFYGILLVCASYQLGVFVFTEWHVTDFKINPTIRNRNASLRISKN